MFDMQLLYCMYSLLCFSVNTKYQEWAGRVCVTPMEVVVQAEFLNGTKNSICSHVQATYVCVIALTSTFLADPVCQCLSTSQVS